MNRSGTRAALHVLIACACLGTLTQCAALQDVVRMQRPNVVVDQVRFAGLSFQDVDLVFDLKISNPNSVSATLAGFDYDLKIGGGSFLQGQQNETVSIAAGGESTVQVPLKLAFQDLYNAFRSLAGQDSARYEFTSGLTFNLPVLGETRVPVSREGSIPLLQLPRVAVNRLQVKRLGLTGADLELVLGIDNPNGFGLSIKGLDYSLDINGSSWADGVTQAATSIAENGSSDVRIPISLNFGQIGQGVLQLLQGNSSVQYALDGSINLGTTLPLLGDVSLPLDRTGQLTISR